MTHRGGGEANGVGAAAARTWNELAVRLSPIVGEQGFYLLYKRSLHLTASRFSCFSEPPTPPAEAPFAVLALRLEREAPARAEEASPALLATFRGLLNTLIGEALTTRRLASMPRHGGPDESPQEIAQ